MEVQMTREFEKTVEDALKGDSWIVKRCDPRLCGREGAKGAVFPSELEPVRACPGQMGFPLEECKGPWSLSLGEAGASHNTQSLPILL